MKLLTFVALILLGLTTVHAQSYNEVCESKEAKELMGATGSCEVIIVPGNVESGSGMCIGRLSKLACSVEYVVIEIASTIVLNCGGHVEELEAQSSKFRVAALVTMDNGKQTFLDNNKEYLQIKSPIFSISMVKENGSIQSQKLELDLKNGRVELSDAHCI